MCGVAGRVAGSIHVKVRHRPPSAPCAARVVSLRCCQSGLLVSTGSTAKVPSLRAVARRPCGAAVKCYSLAVRSSLTADPFQASCHGVLRSFSLSEYTAAASRNTRVNGTFRRGSSAALSPFPSISHERVEGRGVGGAPVGVGVVAVAGALRLGGT